MKNISIHRIIYFAGVAALLSACASTMPSQESVDTLENESKMTRSPDIAKTDCATLEARYISIKGKVDAADVKPASVDFTDPMQLKNAKDLRGGQMASSVAKTAFLNSVPGAKLVPMLTGSAKKTSKRQDAIASGASSLAYIEGAMDAKECQMPDAVIEARAAAMPKDAATPHNTAQETSETSGDAMGNSLTSDSSPTDLDTVSGSKSAPQVLGVRDVKAKYDDVKEQVDEVKDAVDEVEEAVDELEDMKDQLDGDDEQPEPQSDTSQ